MQSAKAYRVSQKRIIDEVNLWMDRMCLSQNWHVDVEFVTRFKESKKIAETIWAAGYQSGVITFSLLALSTINPRSYGRLVVHELRHLNYAELDDVISKYVGDGSIVHKATDDAIEVMCDRDTTMILRSWRRKKRV